MDIPYLQIHKEVLKKLYKIYHKVIILNVMDVLGNSFIYIYIFTNNLHIPQK